MSDSQPPSGWLLTPLLAFGATLVGAAVLFFAQSELVPALAGGYVAACGAPDCGLGVGLILIATGFIALCGALVAGAIVGVRHRRDPDVRAALRRGLFVSLWCLLGYLVASVAVWTVV